jgi:3-hydroxyisobutyrate dehydrogenase-like beta-hydroxyacid dehydrogenase
VTTVAVVSPGEMGSAVAARLREHGLRVVTALAGRSPRTRERAAAAGLEDAGTLAAAVRQADILLSILPPGRALELARAVGTDAGPLYVDCNAVSPATARAIAEAVGERCVDASIIGGPGTLRLYASGAHAAELASLPLDVRVIPGGVGQASALKMCYAALTKGLSALITESMVAAADNGVSAVLREELADSQPRFLAAAGALAGIVPKAYRWVAEMEEIAATFAQAGLSPRMLEGAADVYRLVESARSGAAAPMDSLDAVVTELRRSLEPSRPAR